MTSVLPASSVPANDSRIDKLGQESVAKPDKPLHGQNSEGDMISDYLNNSVIGNSEELRIMVTSEAFAKLSSSEQVEIGMLIQKMGEDFRAATQRVLSRFSVLASPMVDSVKVNVLSASLQSIDFGIDELSRRKLVNTLARAGKRTVKDLVKVNAAGVLVIIDLSSIKKLGSQSDLLLENYLRRNLPIDKFLTEEEKLLLA